MYIDNQTIVQIFYKMLKARLFEEKVSQLQDDGLIRTPLHLSIGQEATAAAVAALRGEDIIFAPHRNFTLAIAADVNAKDLLAEVAGLDTGLCAGKAGPAGYCDNRVNFYGANALAGGQFAKAVGVALSYKLQQTHTCVVCFAGDGACADGSFQEAVNMACLYELPVIFFIENNCYAARSSVDRVLNVTDIADRAKGFGIPGIITDGNNAVDVYEAMIKALDYALNNSAPILVESKTYRLAGFTLDDDQAYRTNEEIKDWVEYDAIDNITAYMVANGIGIEDDLMMIRKRIEDEINTASDEVRSQLESIRKKETASTEAE